MRFLITLCVSLALVSLSRATHYYRPRPSNVAAGDPCTPRHAATCGDKRVLSENITPAATGFGPNVCLNVTTFEVQTFSYSFQRFCSRRGRRCTFYCTCTNVCNGTMRNVTERSVDCCEGFASSPSSNEFSYWHRYRRHRFSSLQSEGCPMRLMNSVVDCLQSLNLTQFQAQLASEPDLNAALQSDTQQYTIFAPSDEAFDQLSDRQRLLFSGLLRRQTLEAHIANRTIPSRKFTEGSVIRPLEESTLLHITKFERRQRFLRRYSVRTFISGAELTNGDVCQARNGIVHILDSIALFSSESISDILTLDTFSTFKRLLDAADLTKFLNGSRNNSRTVFAPTNDAFSQLPVGAVDCLLRTESRNRRALGLLLLSHVTFPAEYNSTLALRSYVYTFSGIYLVVNVTNGIIYLTRGRIPIQDETPARNGVVHTLPRVFVPSKINFTQLCPDMGTATTPTATATTATTAGTVGTTTTPITTTDTTGTPEVPTDLFSGSGDIVPPIPVLNYDEGDDYEKEGDDYKKEE